MCSQSVEGQLPGIRWGRILQGDELARKEYTGKLWELMKRRYTKHHENSKLKQGLSLTCVNEALELCTYASDTPENSPD